MKVTYVYTDGSAFNNQRRNTGRTCGGIGVFFGDGDKRNVSEPFFEFPITNNRTEIKASIAAIESFMKEKIRRKDQNKDKLIIYSDSQYLINSITKWINKWKVNRWKTANGKDVLNKDLLFNLDHLINFYKDFLEVEFKFVKAHRVEPKKSTPAYKAWYGNMMADRLAKRGTTMSLKAMEK